MENDHQSRSWIQPGNIHLFYMLTSQFVDEMTITNIYKTKNWDGVMMRI